MTSPTPEIVAAEAAALLVHYSFDMGDATVEATIARWLREFPADWIRLAAIEALYQGRYKIVSVRQILSLWQRRTQPNCHFNSDFERLVCRDVSDRLTQQWETTLDSSHDRPSQSPSLPPTSPIVEWGKAPLAPDRQKPLPEPSATPTLPEPPPPENACPNDALPASQPARPTNGSTSHPRSIYQFAPSSDRSDFYARLKTIAQHDRQSGNAENEEDDQS
jgi:hypothetical protein